MCPRLTFGSSAAETVADKLGFEENEEGYLASENNEPESPIDTEDPITIDEFGGAAVGSKILIADDYNSVSRYVEDYRSLEESGE